VGREPLLRIGVVDGDPSLQFNRIGGVARLQDGTIVVADGGSQEVRFFNSSGEVGRVVGGKGEGPGEFSDLAGLGVGPGGSVWAFDYSLDRITWMDGAGEIQGFTTLGPEPPVLMSVGSLPDGTFLLKQLWGAGDVSQAAASGLRRDPVAFVRFDRGGSLVDTLGLFPGREVHLWEENGRGVMGSPPFARNSVGALWGEGVVIGTQDRFELVDFGLDGEPRLVARLLGLDLTLTPGDLEQYIQDRLGEVSEGRRPGLRRELEAMPVLERKPAYGEILSDEAGNLWIGEWTPYPRAPHRWTILDRDGRWLGSVEISGRFSPHAIGEEWILGVEWDELDVEYVVLYPLLKGGGNG
jgi:hypothetical protein